MNIAKKIDLKDTEKIVALFAPYYLAYLWQYILAFFLLAVVSFFTFYFFDYGWPGYIIYAALLTISLFILFRVWFFNANNLLVATNERVVDISRLGWFDQQITALYYNDISDISFRQKGLCANVFGYGALIIQTNSNRLLIECARLRQPQKAQTLLLQLKADYARKTRALYHMGIDTQDIFDNFIRTLPKLSGEQLRAARALITEQLEEHHYAH